VRDGKVLASSHSRGADLEIRCELSLVSSFKTIFYPIIFRLRTSFQVSNDTETGMHYGFRVSRMSASREFLSAAPGKFVLQAK